MAIIREYQIPDTTMVAIKRENTGTLSQHIFDSASEYSQSVPAEWNEHELNIFGEAYTNGFLEGRKKYEQIGLIKSQIEIQKALGIYEHITEMKEITQGMSSMIKELGTTNVTVQEIKASLTSSNIL